MIKSGLQFNREQSTFNKLNEMTELVLKRDLTNNELRDLQNLMNSFVKLGGK